jgi:hypothetical protein
MQLFPTLKELTCSHNTLGNQSFFGNQPVSTERRTALKIHHPQRREFSAGVSVQLCRGEGVVITTGRQQQSAEMADAPHKKTTPAWQAVVPAVCGGRHPVDHKGYRLGCCPHRGHWRAGITLDSVRLIPRSLSVSGRNQLTERLRILIRTNYLCPTTEVKKIPSRNDRLKSPSPPGRRHG